MSLHEVTQTFNPNLGREIVICDSCHWSTYVGERHGCLLKTLRRIWRRILA